MSGATGDNCLILDRRYVLSNLLVAPQTDMSGRRGCQLVVLFPRHSHASCALVRI